MITFAIKKSYALILASVFFGYSANTFSQRVEENAVQTAEDAFGTSIGNESIGLYSASQVRGFSPVTAGNVRLEGLYLDRQGSLSQRLVSGSSIKVGLSAHGYAFPAPTGIVDYSLRTAGDKRITSIVVGSLAYGAPNIEIDTQLPLTDTLGLAAGISWAHEEYYDGADAPYTNAAVIPRWQPNENLEVIPFWSMKWGKNEEVAPIIITDGSIMPPEAPRRSYFGQSWANKDSKSGNSGMIIKAQAGSNWEFSGGFFHSFFINEENFAELFVNTQADGTTTEQVIADPEQRYVADSSELRVSRSFLGDDLSHRVHGIVRGRKFSSRYGGSATALEFDPRPLGEKIPVAEPDNFVFNERVRDEVEQFTAGISYELHWKQHGELSVGLQKVDYRKSIQLPDNSNTTVSKDSPWLRTFSAAAYLSNQVAIYAGHTSGLEETGIAPNNVANRNEALPAIQTEQTDAGIRWNISARNKLVAGAFEVSKPYFSTDEQNRYVPLGDVSHKGMEISLSSAPSDNLNLLFGAVLMRPEVKGEDVDSGLIGSRPLGQPSRNFQFNADYRPPTLSNWSFDAAFSAFSERPATRDNEVWLPGYQLLDIGARYRFNWDNRAGMIRLQVANVTDEYYYRVAGSGSFGLTDGRRFSALLTLDI